ncbi:MULTISPECIES: Gp19/Gp15/Gp42 family protein [unclassified Aeromicrobium]|uniref:Gp19/Gp15/Gp42 family protein n=1 Tax=unclassified Aeromicrobium TaxID=2633570 RepID=UPI000AE88EB8|nr:MULTISPECIES: Gp19/Gp15/Gp42 family protein [unclassified Aeromicrobium]
MPDAAPLWSHPADVRARWVGPAPLTADDAQIATLLGDAEDTVLREFPDMAKRVARADGTDTSEGLATPKRRVVKVLSRMVIRHLRNPEGRRQTQESAGPFQRSTTYSGDEPGEMYLTDVDIAELGGHPAAGGAFTIDTMPAHSTRALHPSIEPRLWGGESAEG